mmetsp:Transcript_3582/g.5269  ORF Transcript_3582/g.5269 Transcript_3582/m.5269 type:complete len:453 (-) Transcript_3582:90-1448(-)
MSTIKAKNFTVYEIKSILDEASIKYVKKSKKAELVDILQKLIDENHPVVMEKIRLNPSFESPSRRRRSAKISTELEDKRPTKMKKVSNTPTEELSPLSDLSISFKQTVSPLKLSSSSVDSSPVAASPSQLRGNNLATPMPQSKSTSFSAPALKKPTAPTIKRVNKPKITNNKVTKKITDKAEEPESWPEEPAESPQIFRGFVILAIWVLVAYAFKVIFFDESYPVRHVDGTPFCSPQDNNLCHQCPDFGVCEKGFLVSCADGYTLKSKLLSCVENPSDKIKSAIRKLGRKLMNKEHCPNADETSISLDSDFIQNLSLSTDEMKQLQANLVGEPIRFDNNQFFWVNPKWSCTILSFVSLNRRVIVGLIVVLLTFAYLYHGIKVKDASRIDELRGAILYQIRSAGATGIHKNVLQELMRNDYPSIYEDYYWSRAVEQIQKDNRVNVGVDTLTWF